MAASPVIPQPQCCLREQTSSGEECQKSLGEKMFIAGAFCVTNKTIQIENIVLVTVLLHYDFTHHQCLLCLKSGQRNLPLQFSSDPAQCSPCSRNSQFNSNLRLEPLLDDLWCSESERKLTWSTGLTGLGRAQGQHEGSSAWKRRAPEGPPGGIIRIRKYF